MRCLEFWEVPFASVRWQEELASRFTNTEALEAALQRLNAEESRVYNVLYQNGGNQPRSFLLSKLHLEAELLDPILKGLADIGLAYILKNRSRLNNSADRVVMNEEIFRTLSEARLIVSGPQHYNPPQLTLENGELCLRLRALVQSTGGVFPEEAIDGQYTIQYDTALRRALAAFPQGFRKVICSEDEQDAAHSGYARKILYRLDGQAMLALAVKGIARKRFRASESLMPGKREITAFANARGLNVSELGGCFSWLAQNGWISVHENILIPEKTARAWLRAGMEQRFGILCKYAEKDGVVSPNGRAQNVQTFLSKGVKKKLEDIADYCGYFDLLRERMQLLAFYWACGVVSLHCNEESVQKIAPAGLEEHIVCTDGKIVIAGDMSLVIAESEISPLTRLYLAAFAKIELDSGVIRARFSEKLFAEGLAAGYDGLIFLRHLERISAKALPQNLVFTLRDWVLSRTGATVRKSLILHISEERADEIMHDPVFLKFVDHRAGSNDIILGDCNEREITKILENHGVSLDFDPDS
jgi:hypothetical protein